PTGGWKRCQPLPEKGTVLAEEVARRLGDPIHRKVMKRHPPAVTAPSTQLVIHSMKEIHAVPACPAPHEERRAPNEFGIGERLKHGNIGIWQGPWGIEIIPVLGRCCDQGVYKSFHIDSNAGPGAHKRADVQPNSHCLARWVLHDVTSSSCRCLWLTSPLE